MTPHTETLAAIQDIAAYSLGTDNHEEMRDGLQLIERICRKGVLLWSDSERKKYHWNTEAPIDRGDPVHPN